MISPRKSPTVRKPTRYDDCNTKLASLQGKAHQELKILWLETFKAAAPKNLSRRSMNHALAYQIQVRAYGGLSKSVQQQLLDRAALSPRQSDTGSRKTVSPVTLTPGTRLMREWHGVMHVVDRTTDGFVWNGRTFKSLSAVARAITGARWNGLAFFGLRKKQADIDREIAA